GRHAAGSCRCFYDAPAGDNFAGGLIPLSARLVPDFVSDAEHGGAGVRGPDRPNDLFHAGVLEEVAGCAGSQSIPYSGPVAVHGEHDDSASRVGGGDPAGRLNAVDFGHANVHKHHVGHRAIRQRDRLPAVRGRSHEHYVWHGVEQPLQPLADDPVVIRDQQPDHRAPAALIRFSEAVIIRSSSSRALDD
ncbi:MAG: hypothetical protein ACTHJI_18135, partial [Leifsonia sp.]